MGGINGWRIPQNMEDWMRGLEKRITGLERRPVVQAASDLMGPALAAHARHVTDCNSDEATFNGFYHIHLGALNSPNSTTGWMGQTIAEATGYGIQMAHVVHDANGTLTGGASQIRRFWAPGGTTPRIYSAWVAL